MTEVINIHIYQGKDYIYCGRGSIFGNPYWEGTREENIEKYRKWFNFLLKDKVFIRELIKLKDKKLACFCKRPNTEVPCHLDVIKEYLDNL